MKPEAALERAGRAFFLGVRADQRRINIDDQLGGRVPSSHARSRALARAARSPSSSPSSAATRSISRNAVVSDATGPNSGSWSRTTRRSDKQSPPSASITAKVADHTARIVAAATLAHPRQRHRQRPVSPTRSAVLREQRGTRMRHQPFSVRRDIYREIAPIACHLQGDPPKLDLQASITRRIAARADSQAAPNPGPLLLHAQSGLVQRVAALSSTYPPAPSRVTRRCRR